MATEQETHTTQPSARPAEGSRAQDWVRQRVPETHKTEADQREAGLFLLTTHFTVQRGERVHERLPRVQHGGHATHTPDQTPLPAALALWGRRIKQTHR